MSSHGKKQQQKMKEKQDKLKASVYQSPKTDKEASSDEDWDTELGIDEEERWNPSNVNMRELSALVSKQKAHSKSTAKKAQSMQQRMSKHHHHHHHHPHEAQKQQPSVTQLERAGQQTAAAEGEEDEEYWDSEFGIEVE